MAVIPLNSLAQRCPVWSGIHVQFAVDWLISLLWTSRPVCRGLRVQFGLENAEAGECVGTGPVAAAGRFFGVPATCQYRRPSAGASGRGA